MDERSADVASITGTNISPSRLFPLDPVPSIGLPVAVVPEKERRSKKKKGRRTQRNEFPRILIASLVLFKWDSAMFEWTEASYGLTTSNSDPRSCSLSQGVVSGVASPFLVVDAPEQQVKFSLTNHHAGGKPMSFFDSLLLGSTKQKHYSPPSLFY